MVKDYLWLIVYAILFLSLILGTIFIVMRSQRIQSSYKLYTKLMLKEGNAFMFRTFMYILLPVVETSAFVVIVVQSGRNYFSLLGLLFFQLVYVIGAISDYNKKAISYEKEINDALSKSSEKKFPELKSRMRDLENKYFTWHLSFLAISIIGSPLLVWIALR